MSSHGVPRGPRTRTDEQKRLDADKIQKYRELEDKLRASTAPDATVFEYTTRLLRLNPEYYTVWNVRRRCLVASLLSQDGEEAKGEAKGEAPAGDRTDDGDASSAAAAALESRRQHDAVVLAAELQFTIPLLLEFPKCYWIWSFRLWVLQQAVRRLDTARARGIWEQELALDSKMLTKDRRNFHAWGYRRQVVEQLETLEAAEASEASGATGQLQRGVDAVASRVESEFAYTTQMIRRDLSNFSAWHQRSKLIPRLLAERGADDTARRAFLEAELGLVREALNVGPEDQSLWFYHQFLMADLTDYTGRPTIAPHLTAEERATYVARELDDVRDLLLDYADVKWIYEALLEYTLAVAKMDERPLAENERIDVAAWLDRLRLLDPLRRGRWDDLEMEHLHQRLPVVRGALRR